MRLAVAQALIACAAVAAIHGCKASVEGDVKTPKSEEEIADFDKPMDPNAATATRAMDESAAPPTLLGARQDLSYKGASAPRCKCLAVAVGQPADGSFQWTGTRPSINPDTQVVLAFSSSGVTCDAGSVPAASYWGYEVVGPDVVVVVESAMPGRPVAQGAIIPRPGSGGHIYVRPVDKNVPYGLPASGGGERCQVAALAQAASPAGFVPAPASSSRKTIKSDEAEPTSTQTEIP